MSGGLLPSRTGKLLDLSKRMQFPYSPFLLNWVFTEESGVRQFSWRMPSIQMQGDADLYTGRTTTFCNTYYQPRYIWKNYAY